jgi:hypothetical protein
LLPLEKLEQGAEQSENTGDRKPSSPSGSEPLFLPQVIPNCCNYKKNGNISQNRFCCHNFIFSDFSTLWQVAEEAFDIEATTIWGVDSLIPVSYILETVVNSFLRVQTFFKG